METKYGFHRRFDDDALSRKVGMPQPLLWPLAAMA